MKIESQTVSTLQQFYKLMAQTRQVRLEIVARYLDDATVEPESVASLVTAAEALKSIPSNGDGAVVALDEKRKIEIELSYEINELEKDIIFLARGEREFERHLKAIHEKHDEQLDRGISMLGHLELRNLITDRDGTVNNYCGRYLSSIQSVYNSVYISRFAQVCCDNAVILTSAPLEDGGLVDITTIPPGLVINAGSKGREYRDLEYKRQTLPISKTQQLKLDELNSRLSELLKKPQYEKFGLIGSGLQHKFGQTTIARQDVTGSIPEVESIHFLMVIEGLVSETDPFEQFFRIEDTGLDIEIILTVPSDEPGARLTDFSKGNGVGFLNESLGLNLATGPNLVCGDTDSDVPMLEECLQHSTDTWSIFVTTSKNLQERVSGLTDKSMFVDEPDTLVAIFNELAVK